MDVLSWRGCDLWMHTSSTNNPRDLCGATSWLCIILEECLYLMLSRQKKQLKDCPSRCHLGQRWKRGQAECDYLLLAVYSWQSDSSWGVNNLVQPQINSDRPFSVPSSSSSSPTSTSSSSVSSSYFSSSLSCLLYCTLNSPSKKILTVFRRKKHHYWLIDIIKPLLYNCLKLNKNI